MGDYTRLSAANGAHVTAEDLKHARQPVMLTVISTLFEVQRVASSRGGRGGGGAVGPT